jgi:DNA-binding HxlR family transcriptional regulator
MNEKTERSGSANDVQRRPEPLIGRWRLEVLRVLSERSPQRLAELRRSVKGISKKVLLDNLRVLLDSGLVVRQDLSTKVKRVEYSIAESSRLAIAQMISATDDLRKVNVANRDS